MTSPEPAGRLRALPWPEILICAMPVLLLLNAFRSGEVVSGLDMERGLAHLFAVVGRSLSEGRLPVWDPGILCGFPLHAAMQGAVFYPFTWLAAVLSPGTFWNLAVVVHMALAGLFVHAWLSRALGLGRWSAFAGACVAMLAGPFVLRITAGHINHVFAYPWIPCVLWRVERYLEKPALVPWLGVAAPVSLLVFAGAPQFVILAALVVGGRLVHLLVSRRNGEARPWKRALAIPAAFLLALLFAAPQLLPTLELMPHTQRVSPDESYEFATTFSLPPENLLTLLAPSFFGNDVNVPYWGRWFLWEACAYVGIAALALSGLALAGSHRQRWLWAAVAAACLLLALGRYTPIYGALYSIVPGSGIFRAPGRFLAPFALAASALTAMGLDVVRESKTPPSRILLLATAGVGAVLVGLLVLSATWSGTGRDATSWHDFLSETERSPDHAVAPPDTRSDDFRDRSYALARAGIFTAILLTTLVAALFALRARGVLEARHAATALTVLIVAELLWFGSGFVRGKEPPQLRWPAPLARALHDRERGPFRLTTPHDPRKDGAGRSRASGVDHVGGFEPMILRRYAELVNVIHRAPPETRVNWVSPRARGPVLRMLGARYWVVPNDVPVPPGMRSTGLDGDVRILEDSQALPRAFLVPEARVLPETGARLRALSDPSFDPRKTVVLEREIGRRSGPGSEPGTARIVSHRPGRCVIDADTPSGGYLVFTESAFPGWSATVDGEPVEILRANHLVQAIVVPPGRHTVIFDFQSRTLGWGYLLAVLAFAGPYAFLVRSRLRRRRDARPITP